MPKNMVSPIDHVVMNYQNHTRTNGIWGHVLYTMSIWQGRMNHGYLCLNLQTFVGRNKLFLCNLLSLWKLLNRMWLIACENEVFMLNLCNQICWKGKYCIDLLLTMFTTKGYPLTMLYLPIDKYNKKIMIASIRDPDFFRVRN
jgi:hypothetical protein